MIRQQSQVQKQFNTWAFTDLGKKFTISKKKNLFKFIIHNILAGQFYESEQVQLNRINERTIEAAFDFKMKAVAYQLLQKSKDELVLQFIVKVEYLGTVFREDIELKKMEMSGLKLKELQMKELQIDIQKVQEMIDEQNEMRKHQKLLETSNFNTKNGTLFKFTLAGGKYLLSLTGLYISQKLYNGECDQYDQVTGQMRNPDLYNIPIILQIYVNEIKKIELKSTKPNFCSSYESPCSLSTVLQLESQEKVRINVRSDDDSSLMINNIVLTVVPFPRKY